jgi:cytochrome c oxidase subunit 2
MIATVQVVSEADFEEWAAGLSSELADLSPEERGGKWAVDFGCIACHSADGSPGAGPTWLGLFGREEALEDGTTVTVDKAYLEQSILNPGAQIVAGFGNVMPPNFEEQFTTVSDEMMAREGLEPDIVDDLIAYIISLSAVETE